MLIMRNESVQNLPSIRKTKVFFKTSNKIQLTPAVFLDVKSFIAASSDFVTTPDDL